MRNFSNNDGAYFFVVRWENGFLSGEEGIVLKQILINNDFPGMKLNHPGGMQVMGNILAIPIEFIGGTFEDTEYMSSIVFYDLTDRENPVPIGKNLSRLGEPAAALGLVYRKDRIWLAVAGRDGQNIGFYHFKTSQPLVTKNTRFDIAKQWSWDKNKINTDGWVETPVLFNQFWAGRYESINFIKDIKGALKDEELYLVAFRYPEWLGLGVGIRHFVELYSVNTDPDALGADMLKKISVQEILCKESTSTEWGSGVYMEGRRIRFLVSGSGKSDHEYDDRVMSLNYYSD